ncbi:MAG: UDP-N-acetylmuramate dehydrogenase [Pseudomonadota bacterium]|nr:UDP-N-acetylmuramate dehydrogenase [Pseudomonadota bacterium]
MTEGISVFNTMRLQSEALESVDVWCLDELKKAWYRSLEQWGRPPLILGGASNVILPKSYSGMIVWVRCGGVRRVFEDCESMVLEVGAGHGWHDLVSWSVDQGLCGIENLALIPGTVGAACVQNIGAYGVSLSDVFLSCDVWQSTTGDCVKFSKNDCCFGYRDSVFKQNRLSIGVIWMVRLVLKKRSDLNIRYPRLRQYFLGSDESKLTLKHVYDAVVLIRSLRLPDVKKMGTVGSFFINPCLSQEAFDGMINHEGLEYILMSDGRVKLFAGNLLALCGWRGYNESGVRACYQNPIVLINKNGGGVVADQVLCLAKRMILSVWRQFGIKLLIEPMVLNQMGDLVDLR